MASGVFAHPYVIRRVVQGGVVGKEDTRPSPVVKMDAALLIQEGLRGVVRLPGGTAHALASSAFPIAVMGKTGTTNDFRDALFVGSTYGIKGITRGGADRVRRQPFTWVRQNRRTPRASGLPRGDEGHLPRTARGTSPRARRRWKRALRLTCKASPSVPIVDARRSAKAGRLARLRRTAPVVGAFSGSVIRHGRVSGPTRRARRESQELVRSRRNAGERHVHRLASAA